MPFAPSSMSASIPFPGPSRVCQGLPGLAGLLLSTLLPSLKWILQYHTIIILMSITNYCYDHLYHSDHHHHHLDKFWSSLSSPGRPANASGQWLSSLSPGFNCHDENDDDYVDEDDDDDDQNYDDDDDYDHGPHLVSKINPYSGSDGGIHNGCDQKEYQCLRSYGCIRSNIHLSYQSPKNADSVCLSSRWSSS